MPGNPWRAKVFAAAAVLLSGLVPAGFGAGIPTAAAAAGRADAVAPTPVAPGWRLVASDDFTGSRPGPQWGEYGGSYGIGANAWSADEVQVSGGVLHVRMDRRFTAGKPYTSGGAAMWGLAQTYGRYEFRAKAPSTPGIDSYVTLWPPDEDSDADATLIELLARPAVAPQQEAAYLTIGYGAGKKSATVPGHYTDGFHSYVIEWTPDHESVSVDGRVLMTSSHSSTARRWIGFITSTGDTLTGTPGASAVLPAEFQIDSLRVYAYAGAAKPLGAPAGPSSHGVTEAPPGPQPAVPSLPSASASAAGPTSSASVFSTVDAEQVAATSRSVSAVASSSPRRTSPIVPLGAGLAAAVLTAGGLTLRRRRAAQAGFGAGPGASTSARHHGHRRGT